jgi:hypothetical protein
MAMHAVLASELGNGLQLEAPAVLADPAACDQAQGGLTASSHPASLSQLPCLGA